MRRRKEAAMPQDDVIAAVERLILKEADELYIDANDVAAIAQLVRAYAELTLLSQAQAQLDEDAITAKVIERLSDQLNAI
ncbi:MAG: hypothetical protein FWE51_04140 [Coriobacteriia bacterium]|nr:hypothetical protein [Coriobacteriia bacterium]